MADELRITGRKLDQPIMGDKMMFQGTAVDAKELDVGNVDTYTPLEGVEYVQLKANAACWYRISSKEDSFNAAVAGNGSVYMGVDDTEETAISSLQVMKLIVDA